MRMRNLAIKTALRFARHPGSLVAAKINRLKSKKFLEVIRILDVGSGEGRPWAVANLLLLPDLMIEVTGLDAISTNVNKAEGRKNTSFLAKTGDLLSTLREIPDNSYDLVFMLDVIEHLSKENGYLALYELNRVSTYGIGITTPNGFVWQTPDDNNPFQAHISGWAVGDLRRAGFDKILGLHGLRILTQPYGKKRYPLRLASYPLYALELLAGVLFKKNSAHLWAENSGNVFQKISQEDTVTEKLLDNLYDAKQCPSKRGFYFFTFRLCKCSTCARQKHRLSNDDQRCESRGKCSQRKQFRWDKNDTQSG